MTFAVADAPATVYDKKLYTFGGYKRQTPRVIVNYTQQYDPYTNKWTTKTAMPTARWGAAAAISNGQIYVFGGSPSDAYTGLNKCECYDPLVDSWKTKTNLPAAIAYQGLMAVTVGTKIYLFYKTYCYEFDPAGDGGDGPYTQKSSSTQSITWATCAVVNNVVYLCGGANGSTARNIVRTYTPSTDTWDDSYDTTPYAAYGTTRDNPVINNKIYYGFGQGPTGTYHKKMYRYEPVGKTWTQLPDATYARDGLGCGVINNKLYVIGGRADTVGLNYNEEGAWAYGGAEGKCGFKPKM